MKKNLLSIFCLISLMGIMQSCTKETEESSSTSISDQTIARMAQSSTDLICMTTSNKALQTSSSFRIKMNSAAAEAFRKGDQSNYPNNSLLVREAIDENGNVTGSDIMYRSKSDPNSHNGWIWTRTNSHGEVIYNASERGAKCQSCHSGSVSSANGM